MLDNIIRFTQILEIVGDIIKVKANATPGRICFGDMAWVESSQGLHSLAQVIRLDDDNAYLQLLSGSRGFSSDSTATFLGRPLQALYSGNLLGRIFRGDGTPSDSGPEPDMDIQSEKVHLDGPVINPIHRLLPSRMIRTDIPMIDLFNSLVESQKISVFTLSGEPYNRLISRIGVQADVDLVIFGGIGLIFDDFHYFRSEFEKAGKMARTIMYMNLASDPVVERLLVPDIALAVAEKFAVEENKRVLVLLTDMTAYVDAAKEVGIAMEMIPSIRGYMGNLYSQLARRYERAVDLKTGGSVTILSVTTMPGGDVTHPIPDNTGYITEGQFYLRNSAIDPFGSLSRLKQLVIGKSTREDHAEVMNAMVRLYANSQEAEQKRAMAFELSEHDLKLLEFGRLFKKQFMPIDVQLPLEEALDLAWKTMAECFPPEYLLINRRLTDKYYPSPTAKD
ncbi:MAG: V-type ATP synthase subunit B [Methylohalobius sp. ZOD2]